MVLYAATAGVTVVSLALAAGALVCVIARFVVTFRSYLTVLGETEYEATTDALTGLGNRRSLNADLEAAFASRQDALLLLFDLNGFKGYNDTFGHPAGDALLGAPRQMSARRRRRCRHRLPHGWRRVLRAAGRQRERAHRQRCLCRPLRARRGLRHLGFARPRRPPR